MAIALYPFNVALYIYATVYVFGRLSAFGCESVSATTSLSAANIVCTQANASGKTTRRISHCLSTYRIIYSQFTGNGYNPHTLFFVYKRDSLLPLHANKRTRARLSFSLFHYVRANAVVHYIQYSLCGLHKTPSALDFDDDFLAAFCFASVGLHRIILL